MTEAERAERIRRLQERRSVDRPTGDTQPIDPAEAARAERIRRLRDRQGVPKPGPAGDPTLTFEIPVDPTRTLLRSPASPPAQREGQPRRPKRSHRAEASRIASAGAGVVLTFSLMSTMAAAETATEDVVDPSTAVDPSAAPVPSATSFGVVSRMAPAVPPGGQVPVILTPIQTRTRVISTGAGQGRSGGSTRSGGAPVATNQGSVQDPAPTQAPPPPPTTKSNGSK